MSQVVFTRKDLYDLVWSEPLLTLSKKYNISDNGLRKICGRMNIPLPRTGHWQKVKHGRRTVVIELPVDDSKEQQVTLEIMDENSVRKTTLTEPVKELQVQIELDLKEALVVFEKLSKPDPLIIATKERFIASSKRDWDSKIFKIYPDGLDITVSIELHARSFRFFDTLIKTLRMRNHDVKVSHRETVAVISGGEIKIRLREKNNRVKEEKHGWTSTVREPTGVLYFGAKASLTDKTWIDGSTPIEKQLSNIIAYLEIKGQQLKEERIERELERERREEKKWKREEFEKRQNEELNDFKLLLKTVERWQQLKLIRGYIDELEAKNSESNHLSKDIDDWIIWARKKADWYDPQVNLEDELLKEVDKEQLVFKRSHYSQPFA